MDLATITAGGGLEEAFFWIFGTVILSIGAVDTWYKERYLKNEVQDD